MDQPKRQGTPFKLQIPRTYQQSRKIHFSVLKWKEREDDDVLKISHSEGNSRFITESVTNVKQGNPITNHKGLIIERDD